ncbi:MAG: Isoprenylcysteine carboxylmethyltransferase family protein, partial [Anaerolineales bacterium]|nr:Isoprenylcysteine carboxylmethyltransferase family protein [Anaerolineales bacterium]
MSNEIPFRLITVLLLAAALSISIYFRSRAEREGGRMRTSEGRGLVVVLRLLGLLVLLPLVGYLINPDWVAWARFDLPDWARWVAALVAFATIPLFYWIFASI